jgi:exonuclease VII small subunit
MSSRSHTRNLADLRGRELKAKQANREAELAAQTARTELTQAEQRVVEAHAGVGELRGAQRAHVKAKDQAEDTDLRARGAQLKLKKVQAEIAGYRTENWRALIEESEPDAHQAVEQLRQGVELIREGHALWAQQAQLVNDLLNAGGLRAGDNMPHEHQLTEIARMLRSFDGEIKPPLPHYRALHFQEEEQRTAARLRQEQAAA